MPGVCRVGAGDLLRVVIGLLVIRLEGVTDVVDDVAVLYLYIGTSVGGDDTVVEYSAALTQLTIFSSA